ncbi:MAG TPA: cell division protein ZipA C-terminal FtsZ-binding domain-containing protein [Usitatibacter sp.]|nr:cell division protein ZipA C-terminal FtsZ-binding domain-containing protein [Usitatibacter sp.]
MSDLQLALLAFGAVIILAVVVYNVVQERRARGRAEKAFGSRPPDALFEGAAERREPTLGALPASADESAQVHEAPRGAPAAQRRAPGSTPSSEISNHIDTVAVILSDTPVAKEQLEPLLNTLQRHTTRVHVEGIVDEQWHPVDASPRHSWRELRVGLQLASRSGPMSAEEITSFNEAIADFAKSLNAISQREAPAAAAARARALDEFCAQADIEVAINVVGQFGATFAMNRVKALALEHGLSESASGELICFAPDGSVEFALRRFEDPGAKAHGPNYATGLTFALDVPHVVDAPGAMADMVKLAQTVAGTLGGQLVDDKRKPLTEPGVASIRRSLEQVVHDMEAHGIPAGSPLARRLFA